MTVESDAKEVPLGDGLKSDGKFKLEVTAVKPTEGKPTDAKPTDLKHTASPTDAHEPDSPKTKKQKLKAKREKAAASRQATVGCLDLVCNLVIDLATSNIGIRMGSMTVGVQSIRISGILCITIDTLSNRIPYFAGMSV